MNENSRKGTWGTSAIDAISDMPKEMQKTLPDIEELKKLMDTEEFCKS